MYGNYATDNHSALDRLPYVLGYGRVEELARELADRIIAEVRSEPGPIVWLTGNSYMPAFRSFASAEYVWNAGNNRDGELFALLTETVEYYLASADIYLASPDYDNCLYGVDLRRWRYRDDADVWDGTAEYESLSDEWEEIPASERQS